MGQAFSSQRIVRARQELAVGRLCELSSGGQGVPIRKLFWVVPKLRYDGLYCEIVQEGGDLRFFTAIIQSSAPFRSARKYVPPTRPSLHARLTNSLQLASSCSVKAVTRDFPSDSIHYDVSPGETPHGKGAEPF